MLPTPSQRDWLTTAEIAAAHQVKPKTVLRWILNGVKAPTGKRVQLLASKIGNVWRVKEADLSAYLASLRNVPPEELGETEAQLRRRAREDQRRAAEVFGW